MLTSEDLAFFSILAGSNSLAESARKLNVTPPAVTQRLRALEEKVGVRLIDRSGPRLRLTEEGSLVASHSVIVSNAIESLSEALADRRGSVRGHLRIAAPHGFGRTYVAPVVDAFAREHSGATATLQLSDHPAALLVHSYDVVIHIGAPGHLDQIVTTLAPNPRILCASPKYLDAATPISVPTDLAHHRCLAVRENDEDVTLWRFKGPRQETATVRIDPVMSSNDGAVIREWAIAGQGLMIRSEWNVAADISEGRLRQVLPNWTLPPADIVAMLGSRHGRSARTAAFLAMLRQSLKPPPWLVASTP
ncbi:MAG: LysR family transcriptional regulator [Sinorhizobium meliloti]|uniref:LysR family transcriptional regulator n=1 Tax=Rhizobium meliloti TaxID=382 RepID=A0A2J0YXV3_RHIML|nr:LysR family transcriptional regulator [Sinorhizobium meliloti]MCG5486104.1 LysR family transcriptional regulator [Sinorhizobium meliloti]PJR13109.1 LysR family transcriptional regulator [Sinorhizobium meliloti]